MPPYKAPKTLFKICLKQVEALIYRSCQNIQAQFGAYDRPECRKQVEFLQTFLLANIPGIVLDEVCEQRQYRQLAYARQDQRIYLSVYINSSMRKFYVNVSSSESKLDIDGTFWITHLSKLKNIVVLDLHLTCTDEILEVVGKNCSKLEQINIVSRMEPDHVVALCSQETFNALKLKFFVSDVGLRHLSNCKSLKKVTMNKILRSHFGGRMMTVDGIRELVKSLPHIQSITYDHMGLVIGEGMDGVDSLPLTDLSDHNPRPQHMRAAAQLCRNLQHLCLYFPTIGSTDCTPEDILHELTQSDLKLCVLELLQFPFSEEMAALLAKKGSYLTSLLLHTSRFTVWDVRLIGRCCPKLKNLHLKELLVRQERTPPDSELVYPYRSETMFLRLQCLYLLGREWNPNEILPILLVPAKQLEKFTVLSTTRELDLDDVLTKILRVNPMLELKSLRMFTGCLISLKIINYFFKNCPNLIELFFLQHSNIKAEDVKLIHDEVHRNNLDINIYSMNFDNYLT